MFGYLNLQDPRDIGDNEAQEANNCRVDGGKLEFAQWVVDETKLRTFRIFQDFTRDYYVDNTDFAAAFIKRNGTGITGDYPGLPRFPLTTKEFSGGSLIDVSSFTELESLTETWPNATGTYEYAFTYYDPTWGEEGPPRVFEVSATNGAGAPEMTFKVRGNSSEYDATHSNKTIYINIYRRPVGGTDFLYVGQVVASSDPGDPFPTFTDTVTDLNLGAPLETADYIRIGEDVTVDTSGKSPTVTKTFTLIAWFQEKLFYAKDNELRFSVTGQPGFTQAGFSFSFDDSIADMMVKDEILYIATTKRIYALYGSDEEDFVLKNTGIEVGAVSTAMGNASNAIVFGEYGARDIILGSTATEYPFLESIQGLSGSNSQNLSERIEPMMPLFAAVTAGGAGLRFIVGTLNNRFVIWKYSDIDPGDTFADAAAVIAAAGTPKYLVCDMAQSGFLTADSGSTFQYRTKEFAGNPGRVGQFRTGFVVALGSLTVEIYGDGELLTTHSFTFATKTRQRFTVAPTRCNTFSFRFVGSSSTIVYEYGRLD